MKKQILAGTMALMMGFGTLGSIPVYAQTTSENEFYQGLFGAIIDDLFPQQGAETYTEEFLNQFENEFWKEIVNEAFSEETTGTDTGSGAAADETPVYGLWKTVESSDGTVMMRSFFPGKSWDEDGNERETIMEMYVDPYGVFFRIYDETGNTIHTNDSSIEMTMYVKQSSYYELNCMGKMSANSALLEADDNGSARIIEDMRMLSGNTLVEVLVPLTSGNRWFCYPLSHDGNFRSMYDSLSETWY